MLPVLLPESLFEEGKIMIANESGFMCSGIILSGAIAETRAKGH